jgi:transposase, IS30 family
VNAPAEAEDRAVPGLGEGDPVIGKSGKSQIATLAGRATRFTMLVRIPLIAAPIASRRSWPRKWRPFPSSCATERGTNENTNGLLRQYFPKGAGLSLHTQDELDRVAELDGRHDRLKPPCLSSRVPYD